MNFIKYLLINIWFCSVCLVKQRQRLNGLVCVGVYLVCVAEFQGLHVMCFRMISKLERVIRESVDLPPTGSRDSPQRPRGDRTHINPSETTVPNTHTHTLTESLTTEDVANTHTHTLHHVSVLVIFLSSSCDCFVSRRSCRNVLSSG